MDENRIARRGFASMDEQKRREIARRGGIEAHKKGKAHVWTSEEARLAGQKGGRVSGLKRQSKTTPEQQSPP